MDSFPVSSFAADIIGSKDVLISYLPLAHVDDFGQLVDGQLGLEPVIDRLRTVASDPSVLKIGHNIKYDMGVLGHHGLELTPVDDTMLISYVLDGASHGHGMDELAKRHLGHDTILDFKAADGDRLDRNILVQRGALLEGLRSDLCN